MAKIGSVGQCSENTVYITPKSEEVTPLATLSELAIFTGLSEGNLSPFGTSGSAIKFDSEAGKIYRISIDGKSANSMIYFDANGYYSIYPYDSQATIKPEGQSWGIVLFKEFQSSVSRSANIKVEEFNPQTSPQFCFGLGSAMICPVSQKYELTAKGSKAKVEKTLDVALNAAYLEADAVVFSVPNGVYNFTLDVSKATTVHEILGWNGNELKTLWKTGQAAVTTMDACYNWLSFIAVEKEKSDKIVRFSVRNLVRSAGLGYVPPALTSLIPSLKRGAVRVYDNYVSISTGVGSIPVDASFPLTMPVDVTNATEGSFAEWTLPDGNYVVKYIIKTSEENPANDAMFWYDGTEELQDLDTRASATIANEEETRWSSDEKTINVTVTGGKFGVCCVDTGGKSGATDIRVTSIKKV